MQSHLPEGLLRTDGGEFPAWLSQLRHASQNADLAGLDAALQQGLEHDPSLLADWLAENVHSTELGNLHKYILRLYLGRAFLEAPDSFSAPMLRDVIAHSLAWTGEDWWRSVNWSQVTQWEGLPDFLLRLQADAGLEVEGAEDVIEAAAMKAVTLALGLVKKGNPLVAFSVLQSTAASDSTGMRDRLPGHIQRLADAWRNDVDTAKSICSGGIVLLQLLGHGDEAVWPVQARAALLRLSAADPALEGREDHIQILKQLLRCHQALESSQTHVKGLGWIDTLAVADARGLNEAQAVHLILANVWNPAQQHHLLRAVATAALLGDPAAGNGSEANEGRGVLALASDLEAGRPIGASSDWSFGAILIGAAQDSNSKALAILLNAISRGSHEVHTRDKEERVDLTLLLQSCRSRGFDFFERACRLYFPNLSLLEFVDILKGLCHGYPMPLEGAGAPSGGPPRHHSSRPTVPTDPEKALDGWVEPVAYSALRACLTACPDHLHRHLLVMRLAECRLPFASASLTLTIRCLQFAYEVLGEEQGELWEANLDWNPHHLVQGFHAPAVLDSLVAKELWKAALRWADMTALSKDDVIVQQARSILQQWRELVGIGMPQMMWEEIDRLFQQHRVQPWTVAQFFVHQATGIESGTSSAGSEDRPGIDDQIVVLKMAKLWLDGSRTEGDTECPPAILADLDLAINLCASTVPPAAAPSEQGFVPLALLQPLQDSRPQRAKSRGLDSEVRPKEEAHSNASCCSNQLWEMLHETVQGLTRSFSAATVLATVRSLLESGDMVAARGLSKQLASPPIELALVEASVRVFRQMPASADADANNATDFAGVVPSAVIAFLRRRGSQITTLSELLASLSKSCRVGAGGAVCRWVEAAWHAARQLKMSAQEVLQLGPLSMVEALILDDSSPEVIKAFASCSRLSEKSLAGLLAGLFLKSLLLGESWRGKEGAGKVWTVALFIQLIEGLASATAVAHALLQLLLDRHSALPAQVEVEIILAAHRLYTEQGCLDGIDSLVNLTTLSVVRWANQQEFRALATLAAGMGRYKPVRQALDLLLHQDALEAVLQKTPAALESHGIAGSSMNKLAILASIQRAGNGMHHSMAFHHFGLHRELAAIATAGAKEHKALRTNNKLAKETNVIEGQKKWLAAALAHEAAGSYRAARECGAMLLH